MQLKNLPAPLTRRQILSAMSGLLLGMFVSMLATTVVSTSLPVIVHDLKGDQTAYTWVITATLLTTSISTPIWGKLADLFNRKILIQIALIVFVSASAIAGLSESTDMLIAARALQGIGAGGLGALPMIIIADLISPRERGRYMGLFGAVMAIATVSGPLLGGFITDVANWRWNFYIAVPFAAAALFLLQRTLKLPPVSQRNKHIDYPGILLLSASCAVVLIWISFAGKDPATGGFAWDSWQSIAMIGGGIIGAALFITVELRSKEPLIPLSMFRNRTFSLSVLASISIGVAMFGTAVFLSQYMQMARGATPTEAGLMTLPMMGGLFVSSIVLGQVIARTGIWKPWLILGCSLLLGGTIFMSTIRYDTNFFIVVVYMLMLGAGVGMTMQNLVLIVQNTAKPSEMGVASSGVTFFRSLGGTIGVTVMGSAVASSIPSLFAEQRAALAAGLQSLGSTGGELAKQLQTGALPQVSLIPSPVREIIEDIYAQAISHSFLIAIPLALLSLLAIIFLPNTQLKQHTAAQEKAAASHEPGDSA